MAGRLTAFSQSGFLAFLVLTHIKGSRTPVILFAHPRRLKTIYFELALSFNLCHHAQSDGNHACQCWGA